MSEIHERHAPQYVVDVNAVDAAIDGLRGRLKQKLMEIQELLFEIDLKRSKRRYRGPKVILGTSSYMLVLLNLRNGELKAWQKPEASQALSAARRFLKDQYSRVLWNEEASAFIWKHYTQTDRKADLVPETSRLLGRQTSVRAIIGRYHRMKVLNETETSK